MSAQRLLASHAQLQAGLPLPSPCISVCRVHPMQGLCTGCFRTLDEIAAWSRMGESDKRLVWDRLQERALQGDLT